MPPKRNCYFEFRFHSGWVISGFVDESELDALELRNAMAPSEVLSPEKATIFGRHVSALLQEQRVKTFSTMATREALEFHRPGEAEQGARTE